MINFLRLDRMSSESAVECVSVVPEGSSQKSPIQVTLDEPESALTGEQKQVIGMLYQKAKQATQSVLEDCTIDTTIKITQTLAQLIKIVEYVKINDKKIAGSSKKGIVIELGRQLIKEIIQDDTLQQRILPVYDLVAEQTLETIIDVSQVVNTKMKEATSSCLDWVFSLCGKH